MVVDTKKKHAAGRKDDKGADTDGLPLLEEVNQLIEKERLLMRLKLVEQQRVADEWKRKYDALIGASAVGGKSGGGGGNKMMARVGAENDVSVAAPRREVAPPATSEGVQQLLLEMADTWVLDLARVPVDGKLLAQLNADVFSVRGAATNSISVINLASSQISDEAMLPLTAMVGKSAVQAIDLSGNDFGPTTFQQLVAAMKSRRKSPQYLLLNGNLSLMGVSAAPLLSVLTDSTWGLYLSLQDTAHGQLSEVAAPKGHEAGKRAKGAKGGGESSAAAASAGLYTNTVQPHKALDAITTLCDIINPPEVEQRGKGKGKGGAKATPVAPGGIVRTSKLTTMSVLGLTHAHMCTESVSKLGQLLQDAAPSLTDLDLSFSYVGQNGANMLRDALCSSACQLVRLSVVGNNLGDTGITALSEGFVKNKTLTYLDAKTNQICPPGLRALCSALTSGAGNNTLTTIDIAGNCLSQADVLNCEGGLRDWGNSTHLKAASNFPGYAMQSPAVDVYKGALSIAKPPGSFVLYQQPNKTVTSMGDDYTVPGCKIYSVDLKFAATHYSIHRNHPLCLEWSMRPMAERTSTSKDATSGTGGQPQADVPWLAEPGQLRWELHLETSSSHTIIAKGELSAASCVFNQLGEDSSWARCRAIIACDMPLKGALDVHVFSVDGMHMPLGVEAAELVLSSLAPENDSVVGGDFAGWAAAFNANISTRGLVQDSWALWSVQLGPALRGFELMRAMQWTLPTANGTGKCKWQSKLLAANSVGLQSSAGGDATMGYSWALVVANGLSGSARVAAQGQVHNTGGDNLNSVLEAWTWRDIDATVHGPIFPGDLLMVVTKPQSPYEGAVVGGSESSSDSLPSSVALRAASLCVVKNGGAEADANSDATATAGAGKGLSDDGEDCGLGVYVCHNPSLDSL